MKPKVDRFIVALLMLATLTRFPGLGRHSLWFDEALSGLIARLGAIEVLSNAAGSSHPPGYYFLLHLWHPIGESEFALRFPSAWCSIAAVALVARLGRDFFGRRTAHLAAFGMAVSPFQVYYAQEARMYGLAIALSAGVLWAFLDATRRTDCGRWWPYVVLAALGLYVHYYIGLVVLALHFWLLLDWSRARKMLPALLVADTLLALAFLPQVMQFHMEAGEFLGHARWRVAPSPVEPARSLYYLLFGHVLPLWVVPAGLFLTLGLFAMEIVSISKRKGELRRLLLIVVLLPITIVLAISLLVTPIYVERSFAVIAPALVVLLAHSAACATRPSPVPYLGAALAFLMIVGTVLFHIRADPAKPPLRDVIEMVAQTAGTTDVILHLQDASYVPALYYRPALSGVLVNAGQRLWLAPEVYQLLGGRTVQPADLTSTDRMWVVLMPGYLDAVQTRLLEHFESSYARAGTWDWGAVSPGGRDYVPVQVRLYAQNQGDEETDDSTALLGVSISNTRAVAPGAAGLDGSADHSYVSGIVAQALLRRSISQHCAAQPADLGLYRAEGFAAALATDWKRGSASGDCLGGTWGPVWCSLSEGGVELGHLTDTSDGLSWRRDTCDKFGEVCTWLRAHVDQLTAQWHDPGLALFLLEGK